MKTIDKIIIPYCQKKVKKSIKIFEKASIKLISKFIKTYKI